MKIFKWLYKPSGNCPIQSGGWFLNYYFYFRARAASATIEFYNDRGGFYIDEPLCYIKLKETDEYQAGWLSKKECQYLIFKGCLMFLLGHFIKGLCSQKEINPEQIIEKTETEIKVYNTNELGQKEINPSLIIKREEDGNNKTKERSN